MDPGANFQGSNPSSVISHRTTLIYKTKQINSLFPHLQNRAVLFLLTVKTKVIFQALAGESVSMMTNINLLSLVLGPSDHWLLSTVSLGFSEVSQLQLLSQEL